LDAKRDALTDATKAIKERMAECNQLKTGTMQQHTHTIAGIQAEMRTLDREHAEIQAELAKVIGECVFVFRLSAFVFFPPFLPLGKLE
jgi:hypothetical protein